MTEPDTVTALVAHAISEYGPALNVIHRPRGRCVACQKAGPASVHATVLVWLTCGHVVGLPPLPYRPARFGRGNPPR